MESLLLLLALGCSIVAERAAIEREHAAPVALCATFGAATSAPRASDELSFDRYHASEEIEVAFAALARRHPRWFRAGALGESVEGRALPLLAVTDFASDVRKRGFWIDGAIHGGELESAEVVLRVAEALRADIADAEPPVCLAGVVFYLAPVLNPDGRARALLDPPRHGRLNAALGGGVDLNRDFPARWTAEEARAKPGPQPETASVMAFWRAHPEIELAASFHTSVRAFLVPPLPMSEARRARYAAIEQLYQERLDIERVSVPTHARGTTMDWFCAARGAIAFTLEIEGAHRPDAAREERSARRIRAFLTRELDALTEAHAHVLLELAARLCEPAEGEPAVRAPNAHAAQPRARR